MACGAALQASQEAPRAPQHQATTSGGPAAAAARTHWPPCAHLVRRAVQERTRGLGRKLSRLPVYMAETGDLPVSEKQIMMVGGRGACLQQQSHQLFQPLRAALR